MDTTSLWKDTASQTSYPELKGQTEVDIAIIGGGITGMTAAYILSKAGKKVAVLEARRIGLGTTGYSTGNLYLPIQAYYHNIEKKFNTDAIKVVAQSRGTAIDFIEKAAKDNNIDCHFNRRPWYLYTETDENTLFIDQEAEAFRRAGIQFEITDQTPLPYKVFKAIKIENQARFHPLRYVVALAESIQEKNCQIYENTGIVSFENKEPCVINTANGKVIAKKVIMSTHTPKGFNVIQTLLGPYRSYVVAARIKSRKYPDGMFWDIASPHHASSTHGTTTNELDLLTVAGEHHKTGQSDNTRQYYEHIEKFIREHYEVDSIDYTWSAQHYRSADGLPYIGKSPFASDNIFIGTGYAADGLTFGTVAGILLSDLILGKANHWADVFNPSRVKPFASAQNFIKENLNSAEYLVKDYLSPAEANRLSEIHKCEGKLVDFDGKKVAAYRDENDKLFMVSPVCTHLKCIVHWNKAERTWDCPCHGSRFNVDGKVLEGPAIEPLKEIWIQT